MPRMPLRYSDDKAFSQPVADAIQFLKEWKRERPSHTPDKLILARLQRHAEHCAECDRKMVSISVFQKMMAGAYVIGEIPLRRAFFHALEGEYGFVPRTHGFLTRSGEIVPDPLFCEEQAKEFHTLFRTNIVGAKMLIGWARFLPCSLETTEFMEEHHRSVFRAFGGEAQKECTELYNRVGRMQRQEFDERGFGRPWTFWHLMLKKDVVAIGQGLGKFAHIRPEVRKRCLEDLLAKTVEPRWKLKLIVADSMPRHVAACFEGLDCVVCLDDRFVFRRDRFRVITYNTVATRIHQFRVALNAFVQQAEYRENDQTARLLKELIAAF